MQYLVLASLLLIGACQKEPTTESDHVTLHDNQNQLDNMTAQ